MAILKSPLATIDPPSASYPMARLSLSVSAAS